jgi:DNA-binding CsgD family transcriptional regulator
MCLRFDGPAIERELERRGADPAGLAIIRAAIALHEGDVSAADAILSRALAATADECSAGYIADMLVPLLANRLEFVRAAAILERTPPEELRGVHAAQVAIIAALSGDRDAATVAYGLAEGFLPDTTDQAMRAKIVGRGAHAAFNLGLYELAGERALYAAELNVKAASWRNAAHNYSLLSTIYREQYGDADMSRYYAVRQLVMATRAKDASLVLYGLSVQIEYAAEAGDHRMLGSLRRRLLSVPSGTRYHERLSVALGELLPAAWAGDFVSCSTKAAALREGERTDVERMFCEAVLALSAYARGLRDEASSWCASVVARGADRMSAEHHAYRLSRIIVGHVEISSGRLHNGRRLLLVDALRRVPEESLATAIASRTLCEDEAPKWLRGYARALLAADVSARKIAPVSILTPAESELLPIMALGRPVKQVAAELGKRESTVRAQIREIARKLGTHSLVESIAEARRQGLL